MESRALSGIAALAMALSFACFAPAADYGSIHYGGPTYTEARVDDGTWRDAGSSYGSIRSSGESYGHEYDNAATKAKRRAANARGRANDNAHHKEDVGAPKEKKPTSYGSTLQEGHLTISRPGRGGVTQDEAMARLGLVGGQSAAPPPPPLPPSPQGMDPVLVGDGLFYYRPCEFFAYKGSTLAKVAAPPGARVFDLSDAAVASTQDGSTTYTCGDAVYRKVMVGSSLVYQVTGSN